MSARLGRLGRSRTLWGGLLVTMAVAAPCAAWFVAEFRATARERTALLERPLRDATASAARMAARVSDRLTALAVREAERPVFHYQNLWVDPRAVAASGSAVTPSPLADGPQDPLIAYNFQVDERGEVSSPTVNPDFEALSAPAGSRVGGDAPAPGPASAAVGRWAKATLLAAAEAEGPGPGVDPPVPEQQQQQLAQAPRFPVQEQRVAASTYFENNRANELYYEFQTQRGQAVTRPPNKRPPRPAPAASAEDAEVVVQVGPITWHAVTPQAADGLTETALVGTRRVETPDGPRLQGFAIASAALATSLADGEHRGLLLPGPGPGGPGVSAVALPGQAWHVRVDPDAALAAAERDARALEAAFGWRFGLGALLAFLAAGAVIAMIAHAERLSRRRAQFAAAAAHELRTPLAGLRMYGEMLAEGLGNPDRQRTYARRVATEAERLGRVVANVMEYTRLERGSLRVAPRPGDLGAAVRASVERLRPAAAAQGAHLELIVPAGLPPASFDGDAMAQVMANLVDNAEKYGRGAADRAIVVALTAGEDAVTISVRDHGPGVSPGLRRDLFKAFRRGAASQDQAAGLGLGLALTRALVEAQGGRLTYADAPGGGADFRVALRRTGSG